MYIFRFKSIWNIEADLITIWNHIAEVKKYPLWWPGVEAVELLTVSDLPISLGAKTAYVIASPLYMLHYQTEVKEFETGKYILAHAEGDLVGTGRWTFQQQPKQTQATFDWEVALTPLLLRTASYVPGAKSIMGYFHKRLMANGETGLKKLVRSL